MTLARRLTAVEKSLTPTRLVLRWLAEAHTHGSFEGYARLLLDGAPEDVPLTRLCKEAARVARANVRSRLPEQVDQATLATVRETAFRFLLVLRINVTALELLQEEQVYHALAPGNLALLASASPEERQHEFHRLWLSSLVQLLMTRAELLDAAERARALAEERYLDGFPALFPDTVAAWERQLENTRTLAAMALGLADLEGVEPPVNDEEVLDRLVERRLTDLVEWAKVTALEKLGQGERGWQVAVKWLGAKHDQATGRPVAAATLIG